MNKLLRYVLLTLLLTAPMLANGSPFNYLKLSDNKIISTHELKFAISKPAGFKLLGPTNYSAEFNNHPFNITFAAFTKHNKVLAIHAERVSDNSGYLDYSYMEPATLDGIGFYQRVNCAELSAENVSEAQDLAYLAKQGFNFNPAIYLIQFFINSDDGNAEYVITYGEQVTSCDPSTISAEFKTQAQKSLQQIVELVRL